jgi:hypothetical protein
MRQTQRCTKIAQQLFLAWLSFLTTQRTSHSEEIGQSHICSATRAVYPVSPADSKLPLRRQARWELRSCEENGGAIQILGFKTQTPEPTVVVNTGDTWTEVILQVGTVFVVQVAEGTVSLVYILNFDHGKPMLVKLDGTSGGISYKMRQVEKPTIRNYVVLSVPVPATPNPPGEYPILPPHLYSLDSYGNE